MEGPQVLTNIIILTLNNSHYPLKSNIATAYKQTLLFNVFKLLVLLLLNPLISAQALVLADN